MRKLIIITVVMISAILSGCNSQNVTQSIENKVELAKEEITGKLDDSIKNQVNESVDSALKSLEGVLDPKLGEIRNNMENIEEVVLIYYKVNKKMPIQSKVESFFEKSFEDMKIEYKPSTDNTRAFLKYTGKDYTKEKVPDIIIDPNSK